MIYKLNDLDDLAQEEAIKNFKRRYKRFLKSEAKEYIEEEIYESGTYFNEDGEILESY